MTSGSSVIRIKVSPFDLWWLSSPPSFHIVKMSSSDSMFYSAADASAAPSSAVPTTVSPVEALEARIASLEFQVYELSKTARTQAGWAVCLLLLMSIILPLFLVFFLACHQWSRPTALSLPQTSGGAHHPSTTSNRPPVQ
jgi:hypothetical protein